MAALYRRAHRCGPDIRQAQVSEAEQLLVLKQQSTFESLSQTYFGVVLAAQVVQTKQEIEQGLAHHLDHAKKLEAQGQIAKVERLSAQSAYDRARIDTQKARRSLEIAQLALGHMLKLKQAEPNTALFINEGMPALSPFVEETLSVHPGLKLLTAKKEQAQGMIKLEKGKYAPELFLFGNYNLYEDDSIVSKTTPDWLVGVGVSMPLVSRDGRLRRSRRPRAPNSRSTCCKPRPARIWSCWSKDLARGCPGTGGVSLSPRPRRWPRKTCGCVTRHSVRGSPLPLMWSMPRPSLPGSRPSAPPLPINT